MTKAKIRTRLIEQILAIDPTVKVHALKALDRRHKQPQRFYYRIQTRAASYRSAGTAEDILDLVRIDKQHMAKIDDRIAHPRCRFCDAPAPEARVASGQCENCGALFFKGTDALIEYAQAYLNTPRELLAALGNLDELYGTDRYIDRYWFRLPSDEMVREVDAEVADVKGPARPASPETVDVPVFIRLSELEDALLDALDVGSLSLPDTPAPAIMPANCYFCRHAAWMADMAKVPRDLFPFYAKMVPFCVNPMDGDRFLLNFPDDFETEPPNQARRGAKLRNALFETYLKTCLVRLAPPPKDLKGFACAPVNAPVGPLCPNFAMAHEVEPSAEETEMDDLEKTDLVIPVRFGTAEGDHRERNG